MGKLVSPEERFFWRLLWDAALNNVPKKNKKEIGWTTLGLLLEYPRSDPKGRNAVSEHMRTARNRGCKPAKPSQQKLLRMFGGTHGKTMIKAVMIQRGIDLSEYKIWP